jgi:plasmid stabilization system protein ParE
MIYRVVIQPPAQADIEATYLRIAAEAPETAVRWYNGLIDAIESLSLHPRRCALAPENPAFEHEIRHLLYGRTGRRYRVLFTVVDDRVHVLHFRHWAQRTMSAKEILPP